jgi:uncharacterized protein (TIGR02452 family)
MDINNRQKRQMIYKETQNYYKSNPKPIYDSTKYKQNDDEIIKIKKYNTSIKIYDSDTLDCAINLKNKYNYNICILNMANPTTPGGGVIQGAMAQEESVFRRSNYFQTLKKELYPINDDEIIYSPNVNVSRMSENDDFKFYDSNYEFSFIASCAPINPTVNNDTYAKYYQLMYHKICHIFDVALMNGHDCILLGALGCGAFRNPPHIVAEIFKEIIPLYKGCFKEIAFAIIRNYYKGKMNQMMPENYDIFTSILLK